MIMKKLFKILLTSTLTLGLLLTCGCSNQNNQESSQPQSSQEETSEASTENTQKTKLRVASYNIAHVGQYNFSEENYKDLADNINSQNLDIVGIQEAVCGVFSKGSPNERYTDSLAKLKELTSFEYAYYLNWNDESNTAWGILSKYPITNLNDGTLTEASIESLTTNNDHYYNETQKNTVPNYIASTDVGATVPQFEVNGKKISFAVAHSKPANYEGHFKFINGDEDNFILVGDFNNPKYSDLTDFVLTSGKTLGSNMSLVNNENNKIITFPRDQKFMDNILYTTGDFTLISSGAVNTDSTCSDHLLLWAEFEIE